MCWQFDRIGTLMLDRSGEWLAVPLSDLNRSGGQINVCCDSDQEWPSSPESACPFPFVCPLDWL